MKFRNIIACVVVAAAMAACTAEEPGVMTGGETTGGLTIVARATDLMPQIVLSRADVGPEKRAEEKEIKSLHLFFFNADGSPLKAVNPSVFDFYKKVVVEAGKQPAQNMPSGAFVGQSGLTNVTVVAVANIFGDSFRTENNPDGDIVHGDPTDANAVVVIDNISKLKSWLYRIEKNQVRKDVSKLPEPGMPMFGILEGVDLSKEQGAVAIPMQALMARVDVNVKLDANQTSHDHQLPTLHITKYGVANMPGAVPFFIEKPSGYTTDTSVGSGLYNPDLIDVSATQPIMYDGQEAQSFSYYTYENIQQPAAAPKYPDGVNTDDDTEIQRWKPTIAPENASNLVMHGHYVTHQGLQYDAQFTVYLGENTYNDFEVHRNRAYINNIVIKGLDYVRQDPSVYTFDGRVNVKTDNPVYISVVNERKIDAHATALPIDVYFLRVENGTADCHSEVKIKILADASGDIPTWLRLEKIPAREMMPNYDGVNFPSGDDDGRVAGTGARKYFTTNLLKEIEDNTEVAIGNDWPVGTDMDGGSRSRVYVYIDENTDVDAPNYGDRTATLQIYYKNNNGEVRDRTLEIDQKGLIKLQGVWSVGNDTENIGPIYMEYYEEYLDHKDPLDKHKMPGEYYDGLLWGPNGSTSGFGTSYDVYTNGQDMTEWMVKRNPDRIKDVILFNENVPESAFHYCAGKNKRSVDGSLPDGACKWYMPGIRELEYALSNNYSSFKDFQGEYYWSAAAGKRTNHTIYGSILDASTSQEAENRARATRIDETGNYISSVIHYNIRGQVLETEEGSKERGELLRVRAFYKP